MAIRLQELAETIRRKLAVILSSSTAFSVLSDGSQARKTASEKELVMVLTVRDGAPVCYVAALQEVDEWGDATAINLKAAIDAVFIKKLEIQDKYLVCHC